MRGSRKWLGSATFVVVFVALVTVVFGNGGPFVIKYPSGDPAAKGVLARLDPDLRPGRETRLRVVKEDLKIVFQKDAFSATNSTPLATVSAIYTIENPTDEAVSVDFGFPILRGIYMHPFSMEPTPSVSVQMGGQHVRSTIVSNSAIYGLIRQRAREVIDKAIAADAKLAALVSAVKEAKDADRDAARKALADHLTGALQRNERDAALLVEYAGLDFGKTTAYPRDRAFSWFVDAELHTLLSANLGALGAIGEQKATQFFAQLASRFDPKAAAAYEAIFTAWGGDVRERSVDLTSGEVRPREITVDPKTLTSSPTSAMDPTIYARVDYFDEDAKISEAEKAACKNILKNLPVVFTFAPMNLLHYQVTFPAKATQTLTVTYQQYAYHDTRAPESYQLAYVVHPASMWDDFGPINLEVTVPAGVTFRASVPCEKVGAALDDLYRATLKEKTGEIFLAVDAAAWRKAAGVQPPAAASSSPVAPMPAPEAVTASPAGS